MVGGTLKQKPRMASSEADSNSEPGWRRGSKAEVQGKKMAKREQVGMETEEAKLANIPRTAVQARPLEPGC